jgi:hypothetical protein
MISDGTTNVGGQDLLACGRVLTRSFMAGVPAGRTQATRTARRHASGRVGVLAVWRMLGRTRKKRRDAEDEKAFGLNCSDTPLWPPVDVTKLFTVTASFDPAAPGRLEDQLVAIEQRLLRQGAIDPDVWFDPRMQTVRVLFNVQADPLQVINLIDEVLSLASSSSWRVSGIGYYAA